MAFVKPGRSVDWIAIWILFSAWSSASGWVLSMLSHLDVPGVLISYTLFLIGLILSRKYWRTPGNLKLGRLLHSRFAAPRIWLLLTGLALVGGLLYSPTNYDFLTYRFARVLHWAWQGGWFWIPTANARMNYSGTGFEWMMTPLFILFKTDRLFFALNFIPYIFLPALVFSVFSQLGISRRICWWWMWILPCGYCYILQAASAGNDSFAATYILASLYYLFRARNSAPVINLFLSCLAIGLLTGAKACNLPLVLPWMVLLYFERGVFLRAVAPPAFAGMLLASAAVSFLPMAVLNVHYAGDYAGDPANRNGMKISNPVIGIVGNGLQLVKDNFAPPILPRGTEWGFLEPSYLKPALHQVFPRLSLYTGEMQIEEDAGVGIGVMLVLLALALERLRVGSRTGGRSRPAIGIAGSVAVAMACYMGKMGSESTSRLVAAYYPLLVAGFLVALAADGRIVHRGAFRCASFLAMISAIPLVILSPSRPLFPVQVVSRALMAFHFPTANVDRFQEVYRVYALRADPYGPLTGEVPPTESTLGFLQVGNDSEAPLWRPFGTREVIEVYPQDSLDSLKTRGVHFILVSQPALSQHNTDLAAVLARWSASVVTERKIDLLAHQGPKTWYLIRL